jgi:UDP-GlcNAc:undecaprenyl-phosphate/decaprenyl-phosphate GlcNAc-1-phosphate transferase
MIVAIFFTISFSFSLLINGLLLKFARNLGIRNYQEFIIRWSNQTKPALGGISFYIVFLFAFITYALLFGEDDVFRNKQLLGLFGAANLAFFLGLADDAYNTRPLLKLAGQITAGLILVVTGSTIPVTLNVWIDGAVTIIWVVGVMNSVNMLDNMDGITASVSMWVLAAVNFGFFWIYGMQFSVWLVLNFSLMGALLGFLHFNRNPSKMFMGDAGSMFIGLILAFMAINPMWNIGLHYESHRWIGFLVTLVAFTPAAADTLTVIINRLKRGQSPMVGGKDHTTHHLVYRGFTDKQVGYIFTSLGAGSAFCAGLMIYFVSIEAFVWAYLLSLWFPVVFVVLYRNTLKYKAPQN